MRRRGNGRPSTAWAIGLAVTAAAALWACGGDEDAAPAADPVLSAEAARGKQVLASRGCLGCHSTDGRRSAGPTFRGAFGSEVTLTDGRTVAVDEAYLVRAIKDPWAEKVKGFTTTMPRNALPDDEVAAVVAYIKAIGAVPAA